MEGRALMERGRQAGVAGDAARAREAFAGAEAAFGRAASSARNPLLRGVSAVPLLGRSADAAAAIADAGVRAAKAGAVLTRGIDQLPDGMASLGPRDGRIPVEPYRRLAPSVRSALRHIEEAGTALRRVPTSWVLGPIGSARRELAEELESARRGLTAAALVVSRFPAFLGEDGPRRYFFAAETPAELRGTGGLIGSYSILTIERGRLAFSEFREIETIPQLGAAVEPPNEDYARRYPRAAGFASNVNLTPDFPSAATAIERLYERATGEGLDGVIAADPFALEAMMAVTGAVSVPGVGRVDPSTIVPLTTNGAYAALRGSAARSRVLGDVARAVLTRFLAGGDPRQAAAVLAEAATGGNLTLHVADRELQRGFALAGVDGSLPPVEGDFLGVVVNNGAGNKADYFHERSVTYEVQLGGEGAARADVAVRIRNDAPTSGQPPLVIGPTTVARRGETISLVSLFLAPDVVVRDRSARGGAVATDTELGHAVLDDELRIESGGAKELGYSLALPDVWSGSTSHGTYRLTFLGQTTIRPTSLRVVIRAPAGTEIVSASESMEVRGETAVWEGTAQRVRVFEVEFQKPIVARAWDAVVRFLSKRLISL